MTTRLRRIARSPFAADLQAGRFDRALFVVGLVVVVSAVLATRGQHLTYGGWQPIPH
ncbi:hypothetical protein TEK04_19425 [Klenkia sp. LSe6-5]|uniref:Uncharacterized protein n=1 Tax=Klenkia sesuvii TaxID=3103137 RepID=A0ABU8DYJ2_9ACTN